MLKSKLHQNIAAGFAIVWLIMTAVIIIAVVRMASITERLDKIASEDNIKIAFAVEMRDIIYQRQLLMRNSLIYGDIFERETNGAKLGILAQQFVTLRNSLKKLPMDSAEKIISVSIDKEIAKAYPRGRQLVDEMLFDGLTDSTKQLAREVTNGQLQVIRRLNELVSYETKKIALAVENTRRSQYSTQILILMLGGFAAVINIIIAILVVRHSRRQTSQIEMLARFPSENPRPVMRISFDGELIYANTASSIFLNEWETEVGHMVPLEWQELVKQISADGIVAEKETKCEDKIYSMVLTPVNEGKYINIYGHDVTEREQIREEFAHMASHDSLTGLINRREFELVLDSLINDAKSDVSQHAFMYFDLDQFKVVNDTCGHVAGDEMLRQLSAVLKENVRESDKLGRLGGDEFGLLLRSCSLERAEHIAENLRELIEKFRFVWKEQTFNVGASIGLVPVTANTGGLSTILSAADTACYIAKDSGRNRVHVSHPDDEQLLLRRGQMEWVQRIREALDKDQFELYCQEIFPLAEDAPSGQHGELLLRLFDSNGEPISPETFINAAERYDLMINIDQWVIIEAFRLLKKDLGNGKNSTSWFSINLSGQSIGEKNFLSFVIDQLDSSGIPPNTICFEITETAAISNLSRAIEFIGALREKGCRFALDDFGSGLSSFGYLKNLKIDYLKIDGSFVRNMHEDRVSAAMVEAITNVAHEMGISVIAEWVEQPETLEMLRKLNVEFAQGYVLAKPHPFEEYGKRDAVNS